VVKPAEQSWTVSGANSSVILCQVSQTVIDRKGSLLFVNKKKQKNFINWAGAKRHDPMHLSNSPKVFCFFFSKKKTFSHFTFYPSRYARFGISSA